MSQGSHFPNNSRQAVGEVLLLGQKTTVLSDCRKPGNCASLACYELFERVLETQIIYLRTESSFAGLDTL